MINSLLNNVFSVKKRKKSLLVDLAFNYFLLSLQLKKVKDKGQKIEDDDKCLRS